MRHLLSMKKILPTFPLLLLLCIFSPNIASADAPTINSYLVPSTLESGQIAGISWNISGGGHSLIVYCTQGIKLINSDTKQVFPCDTKTSISAKASDGVSLVVANVSGSARVVNVKLIPKDGLGVEYPTLAREASIYVNPSRNPIFSLYSNSTTTKSGIPVTYYWSSNYLDGVNFKIQCNDYITATSTNFGKMQMPCGKTIFQTDLPGTGSLTVLFNNTSADEIPLGITVLPAISPGVYDGAKSLTLDATIASDAQKPISVAFLASRTQIYSGDAVVFNWSVTNGAGANIRFQCSQNAQISTYTSATTTNLSCGDYAWSSPFSPTASTTVTFSTVDGNDGVVTATLFPMLKNRTYTGIESKSVQIRISAVPKNASEFTSVKTAPSTQSTTKVTAPATLIANPTPTATSSPFKRNLSVGMRGEDVKLLQKYLARDKSIYPGGYITGYYGTATKIAVGKYQITVGLISSSKDPLYGIIDTRTRTLLNALQ